MTKPRRRSAVLLSLLIVPFALGSCAPAAHATPTLTSILPTHTFRPSATPEPAHIRTITPQPTAPQLVEVIPLPAAGFSFVPPIVLHTDLAPMQASLSNLDQTILISLAVGSPQEGFALEEALSSFVANLERDIPDLNSSSGSYLEIAGQPAIAAELTGTLFRDAFTGRITIALPEAGKPLYALALAVDPPLGEGWEVQGAGLYAAILDSIRFFDPVTQSASCPVSTDPTYAFDQANPVRVGGDAFGGPARETAYLESLLGPAAQPVTFERTGSLLYGGTILDAYTLTYPGLESRVAIYLDEYSFETLYAPIGFTCSRSFPVTPP